jgi:hypothetical protein
MKKKRFTEEQIIGILREQETAATQFTLPSQFASCHRNSQFSLHSPTFPCELDQGS